MQKSKFVKNPAVRDTSKLTSKLSTHDTLNHTSLYVLCQI